jgi:hypothetical protein
MTEHRILHQTKGGPPVLGTFDATERAEDELVGVFTPDGATEGHEIALTADRLAELEAEAQAATQ